MSPEQKGEPADRWTKDQYVIDVVEIWAQARAVYQHDLPSTKYWQEMVPDLRTQVPFSTKTILPL